ncbi:MAG: hypothetical protein ABH952_05035 [Candidatus Omnitrophota bacterium]
MWELIIGGILATVGGMVSIWFQAKNARKIRMDEIIAEKKIVANNEAYIRTKRIESMLIQSYNMEDVRNKMQDYEEWFFTNCLFLPREFSNKWLTLKINVSKVCRMMKKIPFEVEKIIKLEGQLSRLVREAKDIIYKEMGLTRMKVENLPEENDINN